jgi:lipopolysaccharide transport system ATP-binding protein
LSDVVIRTENLGKQYRIGKAARYRTLRESLNDWAAAPLRWLRRSQNPTATTELIWALRNVSLEVKRGEVVGVIGRNGAGKSTLLKILSRITEPTEGQVELVGRVGSLLEVGTGFHPELTGRENIFLNGALLGMSRREIQRKFDEIVAFAEIEKFLDTPVKHYSSGMYMRLAFAVAAHLEPEILIVDEVLAVGDGPFQEKCVGKMEEVGASGRTVIFVSHNMAAIQRLCRHAVLLDRGKIVATGTCHEVIAEYIGHGGAHAAERRWLPKDPTNGDPDVFLMRAAVLDETGRPVQVVNILRPCFIEVVYYNRLSTVRPTAVVQLMNDSGLCLFSTNEFNTLSWHTKPAEPGVTRARCRLPGNFLAEGTFFILLAVVSYNPDTVYSLEPNALVFQVVDRSSGEGVRGDATCAWPGVIRPMLDWTTEHVTADSPETTRQL